MGQVQSPREIAPMPDAGLTVTVISTDEELVRLGPVWDRLIEESGVDYPFLSHACIQSAWESFGGGNTLHVILVSDAAGPVAIAPLMLGVQRLLGLRLRRLGFIHHVSLERLDFIVARRHREAYAAIWGHLRRESQLWDVLVLPQVPTGSRTLHELPRLAATDRFLTGFWRSANALYIAVRGSWPQYLESLESRHRSNLRRRLKRLFREHDVDVDQLSSGDDLDAAIEEGLRIEAAAWKGEAGTAIACRPPERQFYTRFARRCAERGWLRLRFLRVDGQRVAFSYAIVFRNVLYSLKAGYDPRAASHSPFTLLSYLMIHDAFGRGVARYEFLGAADPWKADWTRREQPHCWLFVLPPAPWARALHAVKFSLIPRLKRSRTIASVRSVLLRWFAGPAPAVVRAR
jgi:CelD/BcsL family acetyltransferase involved in cellulose biosynthesis